MVVPVLAAATALAAMAPPALASLKLAVGNPGLQHFDSDGVVQLDFGLTDQNGQPVGNLQVGNVKVFENGTQAKIVDFRGVGQGRPVDIVFVMDVTASMQPYIDAIKRNMIVFARDLATANRDYRLGLVTFEDYVVSKYPDCNCAYRDHLTSNVNTFISWVGSLHAGGGGDIPEDQLDALAYAASLPFRPNAEAILILITDAPCHVAGDGPDRSGDEAYLEHTKPGANVTDLTGPKVASILGKNGVTLYAVGPPPFIAPQYAQIVQATHGRLYNIITEQGRFPALVRELGKSIATEYSLSYASPRPVEDGTERSVRLEVNFEGQSSVGDTSYQVRGVGGAAINPIPRPGESTAGEAPALQQVNFRWWNAAVPLVALIGLFVLSRLKLGISQEELRAIVEAQSQPQPRPAAQPRTAAAPSRPRPGPAPGSAPMPGGATVFRGARLTSLESIDTIPAEYDLLKDEVSIGRGEDNDVVIPHASVSRVHARLIRRNGVYELTDLNSTNGSFIDNRQIHGTVAVPNGSEVRIGHLRFRLQF